MACNKCGAPAKGRLCSLCEADGRMQEISDDLTEKFDEGGNETRSVQLRDSETPDDYGHARRNAQQLRMAEQELEDEDDANV